MIGFKSTDLSPKIGSRRERSLITEKICALVMTIAVPDLTRPSKSVLPPYQSSPDPHIISYRIEEPPATNRGLFPQNPICELSPAIDNCALSLRAVTWEVIEDFRNEVSDIGKISFVDKPDQGRKHGVYFPSQMLAPFGCVLLYKKREGFADLWDCLLIVPGKLCQRIGTSALAGLIRLVYQKGGHLTRIDINVDDYLRDLNDADITESARQGHYTRYQHWEPRGKFNFNGEKEGWTHYFGSRQSESLVRIYDALPVHGIPATRFEVEFKGGNAKAIGKAITECETDEMLSETLGGILNGTFRFTTEKRNHNTNRIPSAIFWDRFSSRLAIAKRIAVQRIQPTLESKLRWIREQCSKSLAMFQQYYGVDWKSEIKSLLKQGLSRFKAADFALLEASKKDGFTRFWDRDDLFADVVHNPEWWRDWMSEEDFLIQELGF